MVSQEELRRRGRGIGAIVRGRQTTRIEGQRQEQIIRIEKQARQEAEQQARAEAERVTKGAKAEAERNRPFEFGIIEKQLRISRKDFQLLDHSHLS